MATAGVQIKPSGGPIGGSFVPSYQQTGQIVAGGFTILEVMNPNVQPVTVQIVCSDLEFVDKRLFQSSSGQSSIVPWPPVDTSDRVVYYQQIADKSNTQILDQDGNPWLAGAGRTSPCKHPGRHRMWPSIRHGADWWF